jgi:methyltransferase (TIGR00027 family)
VAARSSVGKDKTDEKDAQRHEAQDMKQGQASRTALGAAGHRAAHQELERGAIFADPLALPILGEDAADALARARDEPARQFLRLFIAMRSRFAEDSCQRAVQRGVRQVLVLGAGLDTFAYRLEGPADLRIFELDHPDTQRDKQRRLAAARIAPPAHLAYVAHDFEHGSLTEALVAGGFDPKRRTFVLWLGVTPYLSREGVLATLGELAALTGGVEIVLDYGNPPETIGDARQRAYHERLAAAVAAEGEPFRGFLETAALHEDCRRLGYVEIEDVDRVALVAHFLPGGAEPPKPGPGAHVLRIRIATARAADDVENIKFSPA